MDQLPRKVEEFLTKFPGRDSDDWAMFFMQFNDFELVLSAKPNVVLYFVYSLVILPTHRSKDSSRYS